MKFEKVRNAICETFSHLDSAQYYTNIIKPYKMF